MAASRLALPNADAVLIIGTGTQACAHLQAFDATGRFSKALIYGRDANRAQSLVDELSPALKIKLARANSLQAGLTESRVVATCTVARRPVISSETTLLPGTFIAVVGTDSPGKQKLAPQTVVNSRVIPDVHEQACKVGELQHALAEGLMGEDQVGPEIGGIVVGRERGRENTEQIVIYDSTGTAHQDCAAAAAVLTAARRAGSGVEFHPRA